MDASRFQTTLRHFLDPEGRLTLYPAKRRAKRYALAYLAGKFEAGRTYTEKEVNQTLKDWHTFGDWALLRRELYDHHFFDREANGTDYRLAEPQPSLED
jgi:hypothetical protein